jgi:hypothetical protein
MTTETARQKRKRKFEEAEERARLRNNRSAEEQIYELEKRPGNAVKERAKLVKELNER